MNATFSHIWLWPEKNALRAWTSTSTVSIESEKPEDLLPKGFTSETLVTGAEGRPVESGLPSGFVNWLKQQLTSGLPAHLILSTKLPEVWHTYPYEWLTLGGYPLCQRLQMWRHAPHDAEQPKPVIPSSPTTVLNLWPDDQTVVLCPKSLCGAVNYYEGREDVESFLRETPDLRHHAALCIVAHGSEDATALPFRLADGSLWALPEHVQLPPLVILLACGDRTGNLLHYGKELLDRGAKTVLAAVGQLDADVMAAHFPALLKAWQAGIPIGEALFDWQKDLQQGTHGRLCLLGNGDLRMGEASVSEWPTEQLAVATREGNDEVLEALLQRLTLHNFLKKGHLGEAMGQLREHLQIPEIGEPEKNLALLHRLQTIVEKLPELPSLTQAWVAPLMSHLAEQHDHAHLADCKKRLITLSRQHTALDVLYYDWAKAEYRKGLYARAAAVAVNGLCCTDEKSLPAIRLLGQLTNTLGDLNILAAAQICLERRSERINRLDDAHHDFKEQESFKDRDIRGRLQLRHGKNPEGLLELERKRDDGGAGDRELAWVLYAAALVGSFDDDSVYAAECCARLEQHSIVSGGNSDTLYLLRALSAWAWRRSDQQALVFLERWAPELCKRLKKRQDTGPVGFSLCYLHLAGLAEKWKLPPFSVIAVALKDDRYYLELAIFGALLGSPLAERKDALDKYHTERREAVLPLQGLPDWVKFPKELCTEGALCGKESKEQALLLGEGPITWEGLVAAHLLPW